MATQTEPRPADRRRTRGPAAVSTGDDYTRNLELAREYRELLAELADPLPDDADTATRRARRRAERRLTALKDEVVTLNRPLVLDLMGPLARHGDSSPDDLLQSGLLALWEAFCDFDPDAGYRFSSFATPRITGAVRRAANATEWGGKYGDWTKRPRIRAAADALAERFGRPATDEEIAELLDITAEQVAAARRTVHAVLDAPVRGDDGTDGATRGELIADDREPDSGRDVDAEVARAALDGLPARDVAVALRRWGLDGVDAQQLSDIALDLGYDRETTRRASVRPLIRLAEAQFAHTHGRAPTDGEIGEMVGITEAKIAAARALDRDDGEADEADVDVDADDAQLTLT